MPLRVTRSNDPPSMYFVRGPQLCLWLKRAAMVVAAQQKNSPIHRRNT